MKNLKRNGTLVALASLFMLTASCGGVTGNNARVKDNPIIIGGDGGVIVPPVDPGNTGGGIIIGGDPNSSAYVSESPWKVLFYNNKNLQGNPAAATTWFSHSFNDGNNGMQNWGAGSPLPGINPDTFSARIVKAFKTGNTPWAPTTFTGGSDDGMIALLFKMQPIFADPNTALSVLVPGEFGNINQVTQIMNNADGNNVKLLWNRWSDKGFTTPNEYNVQVPLEPNTWYKVVILYYENLGGAAAAFNFQPSSGIVNPPPVANQCGDNNGWSAKYFRDPNEQVHWIANNAFAQNCIRQSADNLYIDYSDRGPLGGVAQPDFFSGIFSREVYIGKTANYQFEVGADDGIELWIDGAQVVKARLPQLTNVGYKQLPQGWHHFEIKYFEAWGLANLHMIFHERPACQQNTSNLLVCGKTWSEAQPSWIDIFRLNPNGTLGAKETFVTDWGFGAEGKAYMKKEAINWQQCETNTQYPSYYIERYHFNPYSGSPQLERSFNFTITYDGDNRVDPNSDLCNYRF